MKKITASLLLLSSLCFGAEKFDWSSVLIAPPGTQYVEGNQILHFKSKNKDYHENEEARLFVEKYLANATPLKSDAEVLKFGSDHATLDGLFIELGVCTGKTINFIAALNPLKKIYGFDSFEGLPEDWVRQDTKISKGTFAFKNPNALPPVLHNVTLTKGWFQDSLPPLSCEGFFVRCSQSPTTFNESSTRSSISFFFNPWRIKKYLTFSSADNTGIR